jgi:bile acid-coenzyme A ligase
MTEELISLGRRLALDAHERPNAPAVICADDTLTFAELHRKSNKLAHGLAARGVSVGDLITIGLPNGVDFVVACYAVWKLGATPQPVSFRLPAYELAEVVALSRSPLVIADFTHDIGRPVVRLDALLPHEGGEEDLPDLVPPLARAMTSGGSTGRPKLILPGGRGEVPLPPDWGMFGLNAQSIAILPGPLYHSGPFLTMMHAIGYGARLVLLPRFDPEETLRAIDQHRGTWVYLVPTMMSRIWRLPTHVREAADLSSLTALWHMAAPCPAWLKQAYIDWIGPEKVMELYAGTEAIASTVISGAEWLTHRGSVGRVFMGEMKAVGDDGKNLAPNEVEEIYMRAIEGAPRTYEYIGSAAKGITGGWESLGDIGWFDPERYLYLADRRTDMILVGGANVYPAEVEAAIEEHPTVQSCAVIGLPDDDLGNRIHAIVQTRQQVDSNVLAEHLKSRLVTYKQPRSWEFVEENIRDDAGKVRRSALRLERLGEHAEAKG